MCFDNKISKFHDGHLGSTFELEIYKKMLSLFHFGDYYYYIFNVPNLTADIYKECTEYAHIRGMGKIIPGPEHMCSYITTVFICDSADASAISRLRRCRIHKDFRFSLYGWMDMHTAAVIVNDGKVVTNFSGRDNAKNLKTIYLSK